MEIKKNINGYTIEASFDEYKTLYFGLYYANQLWEKYYGLENPNLEKYNALYKEMSEAKDRFITAEEAKPFISCMVCKHCLPPMKRENGRMCTLEKCDPDPA